MTDGRSQPHVLVAVGDDALRDRVERRLAESSALDGPGRVDAVGATAVVTAATGDVDCVVVADDLQQGDPRAVVDEVDVPVVVLLTTDDARSAARLLDAGAADVVPVDGSNRFERLGDRVANAVAWRRSRTAAIDGVSEELKERAMDETPVGITIADFSLPDNPLVYVNDGFEELTGYSAAEALGRNCRYLQGPATDAERVAELRRATDAGEATTVELRNYRRDGTTFWNRVDIAPLRNERGEVTHYVGFQSDVTDRVLAEEAAERYAAAVDRERERLQRLVDHIEGLMEEITEVLVRTETRAELERAVVERVVETDAYPCAWIDDCDLSTGTIVPSVRAGETDATVDGLRIDRSTPDDPVSRAVATGTVRTAVDPDGRFHRTGVVPFRGIIAVPVVHRDTIYGVLVVYTDADVVEEGEEVVFGTLGRAIGAAIDAFESRRTLLTDTPLELHVGIADPDQPLVAVAAGADCRLAYEGSVVRDDGTLLLFVSSTPADADLDGASVQGIEAVRPLERNGEGGFHEIVLPRESLLSRVADQGGRLVDVTVDATAESITLTTTVQDRTTARSLLDEIETVARSVRLRSIREREGPRATHREFAAAVEAELTDRQRTALQLAYHGGFFEWPHDTTGDELADAMGITRATFHQHLRAAERKLVSRFFGDAPN